LEEVINTAMCRFSIHFITCAVVAAVVFLSSCKKEVPGDEILQAYSKSRTYAPLKIKDPKNNTCFPLDIAPPKFRWHDNNPGVSRWLIWFAYTSKEVNPQYFFSDTTEWSPTSEQWEKIKKNSLEEKSILRIVGFIADATNLIISSGNISFYTSKDEVGAPIFYREVNLPFVEAVKDPSQIRWRFGSVSSMTQPPVVLENLPVCGNCHSFAQDGGILAMDVDYANSKGSYVVTRIAKQMVLATSDIISWNDYNPQDKEQTFGLLSQISPDGNFVVSTVRDKSVFVPQPDLAFSQLFFPIKGILCIYNRQSREFSALPGADDPDYVQSNPGWSPDGNYIVFSRAKAYDLKSTKGKGKLLLTREECREFTEDGKPFLFDLYRIPFNGGEGGKAEPVKGGSENGMSNYFARYSPDGKWIVFCKARSYMLLQPDSRLYIIPAEGGEARELECNTDRMNSWHSWSPNSKWLVFSSKTNSDFTQLMLTHIDEAGYSTPPVLLSRFTSPDRAANIPEFVNTQADAILKISENFLNDYSFVRAGNEFFKAGEADDAMVEYRKALELNPNNETANLRLGFLLLNVKNQEMEGLNHLNKVLKINPNNGGAHYDLGMAMLHRKHFQKAVSHLSRALALMPNGLGIQYNLRDMNYNLGIACYYERKFEKSSTHLSSVIRSNPQDSEAHYKLALSLVAQGNLQGAILHYNKAISINAAIDTSIPLHEMMADAFAAAGEYKQAITSAEKALKIARLKGAGQSVVTLQGKINAYRKKNE
jgi:tetratricopeptide (TPR) repeat protein